MARIDRKYQDKVLREQFDDAGGIGYVKVNNPLAIREGYSREWQAVLSPGNSQQNKVAADGRERPVRLVTDQSEWDRLIAAREAAGYRETHDKSLTVAKLPAKPKKSAAVEIDDQGKTKKKK